MKRSNLPLHLDGQVADLVEQYGAAVGDLDPTWDTTVGARERPSFMTEKFTLHQLRRKGRAVDSDEGAGLSRRVEVHGAGQQPLACSSLASQQNGRVGLSG